jgi:hypothetical protein
MLMTFPIALPSSQGSPLIHPVHVSFLLAGDAIPLKTRGILQGIRCSVLCDPPVDKYMRQPRLMRTRKTYI